jgi:hypothetical protein
MEFNQHPLNEQLEAGIRGDFKRGFEIAEFLKRQTPDCNRAAFNRAWYAMMSGDLLTGLELLDRGRWLRAFGDDPLPTDKPIYRDEDLRGKHLLMCSEGGLGDEMINVRFAREFSARGAKVTVACDPLLKSVFARVPGVSSVVGHKAAPEVYHDFWVPAMSAARVLQTTYETLDGSPYFSVDEAFRRKWADYFVSNFSSNSPTKRPKIGLRFYGNPQFEHEQHRRFPIDGLIQAVGSRPWVNLQKEETALKLETWEDTLAVIGQLDLVITSCTSVAHAAAGLGVETWVLLPILPYYVWAKPGVTSPWYNTARLFRQKTFGQWDQVFADVADALNERRI